VRWLYDTSALIAMETDEDLAQFPIGDGAVSVVTVGELQLGVQLASARDLSIRLELIAELEHSWNPIPVDLAVMRRYASIVADCRRRGIRPGVADSMIAATASLHGLGVVTRDRDFTRFAGIDVAVV
jgi:predicted nucleic acid-binding protein